MPSIPSTAILPRYVVPAQSRFTAIATNREITRLVSTSRSRHSYLLPPPEPAKETQDLLAAIRKRAVAKSLDKLVCSIGRQVDGLPLGYLLKVNAVEDVEGNIVPLPDGMFGEIGFGTYPLDALASSMGRPQITLPRPPLKDGSYYVWYTCIAGRLEATTYDSDLSRGMEQRAADEALRRKVLGMALRSGPGTPARAQVAEYWRDIAIRRTEIFRSTEAARQLAVIQASLAAAEDQFNTAYENYVSVSRELANQAAEMQTLDLIGSVLSAAGSVASAHEKFKEWRAATTASMTTTQTSEKAAAEAARSDLMRAQEATARNWLDRGYPPVAPAEVPVVDNPFAEPENATVDPKAAVKRPILM